MIRSTERFLTQEQVSRIMREIHGRYHETIGNGPGEYPPYALTAWDDRTRFAAYVEHVLLEFAGLSPRAASGR